MTHEPESGREVQGGGYPPGWYPDPTQPGLQRFWDGTSWTQHVHAGPTPSPVLPMAGTVAAPTPGDAARPDPQPALPRFDPSVGGPVGEWGASRPPTVAASGAGAVPPPFGGVAAGAPAAPGPVPGVPAHGFVTVQPAGGCERCGSHPAKPFSFLKNTGMIVMFRFQTLRGRYCRSCAQAAGRAAQSWTLLAGWWGFISFFVNCVFVFANSIALLSAAVMKRPDGSGRFSPARPGLPVLFRPGGLVALAALIVLGVAVARAPDRSTCDAELRTYAIASEQYRMRHDRYPMGPQELLGDGLLRRAPEFYEFTGDGSSVGARSTSWCPTPQDAW